MQLSKRWFWVIAVVVSVVIAHYAYRSYTLEKQIRDIQLISIRIQCFDKETGEGLGVAVNWPSTSSGDLFPVLQQTAYINSENGQTEVQLVIASPKPFTVSVGSDGYSPVKLTLTEEDADEYIRVELSREE
ncbi:MAG: hypothetical protein AAF085_13330 [Planctomycetota bacterium]